MKLFKDILVAGAMGCCLFVTGIAAQGGNTIGGHVFGPNRTPIEDITVELQDDFGRMLARVRTNAGGKYFFGRVPKGSAVYRVSVLPLGTNYEEQETRITIQNITRTDPGSGLQVIGAFMNAQKDFYLRVDSRKGSSGKADTIFAQEVPEPAKALYEEGDRLLNNKKNEEGYQKIKSAIETFPDYYLAIERLGLEYFLAGYYRASSILLQRAVQIHPKSYKSWYGLGRAFSALKIYPEALDAANKALEIAPGSVDALLLSGKLLRLTKKFKDSEKLLTKAKSLSKNSSPEVHWELALLYGNNLKKYEAAADELEIWLKLQPKSKDAEEIKLLIKTYREKSKRT